MKALKTFKMVDGKEIPSIPLYMDQVTGYLDEIFSPLKRDAEEKILTKTMINNYVKAGIVSSPDKKKYSVDQIKTLMMIYMLKNTLQMNEIERVLKQEIDISKMYDQFVLLDQEVRSDLEMDTSEDPQSKIIKLLLSANLQKKYAEKLLDELMDKKTK